MRMTILLAEDDDLVRGLVRALLEQAGHRIMESADGASALTLSRSYPGRIDLLIADVEMPGITGPNLALALKAERPGIRILLMSGAPLTPQSCQFKFLPKPFTVDGLIAAIESALAYHA